MLSLTHLFIQQLLIVSSGPCDVLDAGDIVLDKMNIVSAPNEILIGSIPSSGGNTLVLILLHPPKW